MVVGVVGAAAAVGPRNEAAMAETASQTPRSAGEQPEEVASSPPQMDFARKSGPVAAWLGVVDGFDRDCPPATVLQRLAGQASRIPNHSTMGSDLFHTQSFISRHTVTQH